MVHGIYIPRAVLVDIRQHIDAAISRCVRRFSSAYEKEDTVTGQLFGALQTDEREVIVTGDEVNGTWKWEINFGTFGGGGIGSSESIVGADGIIELSLTWARNEVAKKSLLFQSKVDWTTKDNQLYQQCTKLLTWLGAAVVINYMQTGFTAYNIDSVFESAGRKPDSGRPLQQLLNDEFLVCKIGDSDLEYDPMEKLLIWEDINRDTVFTQFNLNRKLEINVFAPKRSRFRDLTDEMKISAADLAVHPLNSQALNPDIRSVDDLSELKKIKKNISKRFHPDKHPGLPAPQVTFLSDLMKNYNEQIDEREKVLRARKKEEKQQRERPDDPPLL